MVRILKKRARRAFSTISLGRKGFVLKSVVQSETSKTILSDNNKKIGLRKFDFPGQKSTFTDNTADLISEPGKTYKDVSGKGSILTDDLFTGEGAVSGLQSGGGNLLDDIYELPVNNSNAGFMPEFSTLPADNKQNMTVIPDLGNIYDMHMGKGQLDLGYNQGANNSYYGNNSNYQIPMPVNNSAFVKSNLFEPAVDKFPQANSSYTGGFDMKSQGLAYTDKSKYTESLLDNSQRNSNAFFDIYSNVNIPDNKKVSGNDQIVSNNSKLSSNLSDLLKPKSEKSGGFNF